MVGDPDNNGAGKSPERHGRQAVDGDARESASAFSAAATTPESPTHNPANSAGHSSPQTLFPSQRRVGAAGHSTDLPLRVKSEHVEEEPGITIKTEPGIMAATTPSPSNSHERSSTMPSESSDDETQTSERPSENPETQALETKQQLLESMMASVHEMLPGLMNQLRVREDKRKASASVSLQKSVQISSNQAVPLNVHSQRDEYQSRRLRTSPAIASMEDSTSPSIPFAAAPPEPSSNAIGGTAEAVSSKDRLGGKQISRAATWRRRRDERTESIQAATPSKLQKIVSKMGLVRGGDAKKKSDDKESPPPPSESSSQRKKKSAPKPAAATAQRDVPCSMGSFSGASPLVPLNAKSKPPKRKGPLAAADVVRSVMQTRKQKSASPAAPQARVTEVIDDDVLEEEEDDEEDVEIEEECVVEEVEKEEDNDKLDDSYELLGFGLSESPAPQAAVPPGAKVDSKSSNPRLSSATTVPQIPKGPGRALALQYSMTSTPVVVSSTAPPQGPEATCARLDGHFQGNRDFFTLGSTSIGSVIRPPSYKASSHEIQARPPVLQSPPPSAPPSIPGYGIQGAPSHRLSPHSGENAAPSSLIETAFMPITSARYDLGSPRMSNMRDEIRSEAVLPKLHVPSLLPPPPPGGLQMYQGPSHGERGSKRKSSRGGASASASPKPASGGSGTGDGNHIARYDSALKCYTCGSTSHAAKDCANESSFVQDSPFAIDYSTASGHLTFEESSADLDQFFHLSYGKGEDEQEDELAGGQGIGASEESVEPSRSTRTPHRRRKRVKDDEDMPEGQVKDGGSPRRQKQLKITTPEDGSGGEKKKLACPFYKRNPRKYANGQACTGPGWDTTHRLKEHLYRKHSLPPSCPRCQLEFKTTSQVDTHLLSDPPCQVQAANALKEGITQKQEKLLRSRRRDEKAQTEVQKWRKIYLILFPETNPKAMPSAFYELDPPKQVQALHNQDDAQGGNAKDAHGAGLDGYEEFLKQQLPLMVRQELERRIDDTPTFGLGMMMQMDEGMKTELVSIMQSVQLSLFSSFKQGSMARIGTGMPASQPQGQAQSQTPSQAGYSPRGFDGSSAGSGDYACAFSISNFMSTPPTQSDTTGSFSRGRERIICGSTPTQSQHSSSLTPPPDTTDSTTYLDMMNGMPTTTPTPGGGASWTQDISPAELMQLSQYADPQDPTVMQHTEWYGEGDMTGVDDGAQEKLALPSWGASAAATAPPASTKDGEGTYMYPAAGGNENGENSWFAVDNHTQQQQQQQQQQAGEAAAGK
ncbi:uncharacterized protein MKZ38_008057 [Zalerion maritima]|uniref:CCHC-type domain-containing protein n=1 Tax=Zalerion maritima TaxID=339359 RepID=A0AAD5WNU0_9PEZI|nr:uncharacterized protein MKZ38_008057 [Zalerion maritima]